MSAPLPPHVWKVWATVAGFLLVGTALGLAVLLGVTRLVHASAWDRVAGEWEQYRLNDSQMNWFKSVRSKQGIPCCNMADGHPTEMIHKADGYWIPDPLNTAGEWLKVPDLALTIPPHNPVGVATVWYVMQNGLVHIRCFVPEAEG